MDVISPRETRDSNCSLASAANNRQWAVYGANCRVDRGRAGGLEQFAAPAVRDLGTSPLDTRLALFESEKVLDSVCVA